MKIFGLISAGLVAADDYLTFDEDFQRVDFYGVGEKLSEKIPEKRECCKTLKV